jgi:hypothetical protein
MRPLCLVFILWLSLAPLGYGVLIRAGVVAERWPAAEAMAARFGPAAGLLPYAAGTLLLAAPVAWVVFPGRRPGWHEQHTWKYTHHRSGT